MKDIETQLFRKFWTITGISFLVMASVYIFVPWLRKPLVRENNILELLTAILFLTVIMLGTKILIEQRRLTPPWVYWGIPLFGLIAFLEETSFGHSFLYYEVPIIQGVKIDALHDFLKVFMVMLQSENNSTPVIVLVLGGSVCLGGLWLWFQRCEKGWSRKQWEAYPPFRFLVWCIGFLLFSAMLDLEFLTHHFLVFIEEFMEATASLSLMFAYLSLKHELFHIRNP